LTEPLPESSNKSKEKEEPTQLVFKEDPPEPVEDIFEPIFFPSEKKKVKKVRRIFSSQETPEL
jgi:hypothetical protein